MNIKDLSEIDVESSFKRMMNMKYGDLSGVVFINQDKWDEIQRKEQLEKVSIAKGKLEQELTINPEIKKEKKVKL
jgi:hypothetical protein